MEQLNLSTAYTHLKDVSFKMVNLDIASAKQKFGSSLVMSNLGNPQAMGQKPLTFGREIMAACTLPSIIGTKSIHEASSKRASELLADMPGNSAGSYPPTQGVSVIRKHISDFIGRRDGFECEPTDIFTSNGATEAIQQLLRLLIQDEGHGIMLPCPQFPLYQAWVKYLGGYCADYQLKEESSWGLDAEELNRVYTEANTTGHPVRAMVIINPNNPTGSVLLRKDIETVVRFAHANGIVIVADEVYQENIYDPEHFPFVSVHQVARELAAKGECVGTQIISVHSASKGMLGECGYRGGYMHMYNIDKELVGAFDDILSMGCPNITGMIAMSAMVAPPCEGEDIYDLHTAEYTALLDSLKLKAGMVSEVFNSWERCSCVTPDGALYAFPHMDLPARVIAAAEEEGVSPDVLYVRDLLNEVGIVVLPGSVFGAKGGFLRMTILPKEEDLKNVLERWTVFHKSWMTKWM
eukprot:gnl/Dysnectes_brevis/426_a469_5296.p1 GENE.gnl/Dysnectes_brevis/426_a469_5296~~gnl/Dysnectes_brevis/426_a469_5296.p1  ORF type:complete len:466 (-),score=213.71 gnl/Dysnectes_brevis/426_a469_5296:87-1484(-)